MTMRALTFVSLLAGAALAGCASNGTQSQQPAGGSTEATPEANPVNAREASFSAAWRERVEKSRAQKAGLERAQTGDMDVEQAEPTIPPAPEATPARAEQAEPEPTLDPEAAAEQPDEAQTTATATIPEAEQAAADPEPGLPPLLELSEMSIWTSERFTRRVELSLESDTDIEPETSPEEREVITGALQLIGEERVEEAIGLVREAMQPSSTAAFDTLVGTLYLRLDNPEEATRWFDRAVQKFPNFRRAWQNLSQIHVRNGDYTSAMPALVRVIELDGESSLVYGMLGFANASLGHPIAAESAYRMAAMMDPSRPDWRLGLAESIFKQERFADAAKLLGELIAQQPERAELWLYQGQAYARLGRSLEAAQNFEMVDRLGKSNASTLANLANIYANEELYGLAVNAYLRSLEKNPNANIDRFVQAAKFMAANRANAETKTLIEGIERLAGDSLNTSAHVELLKVRARLALAEGASDEEARILEQVVELDPLDGDALLLLGRHARRSEQPEKAIFYYERAQGLDDFEADALVGHAQVLVSQGKYGEALPKLQRAQQLAPRDSLRDYLSQVERIAQIRGLSATQ